MYLWINDATAPWVIDFTANLLICSSSRSFTKTGWNNLVTKTGTKYNDTGFCIYYSNANARVWGKANFIVLDESCNYLDNDDYNPNKILLQGLTCVTCEDQGYSIYVKY